MAKVEMKETLGGSFGSVCCVMAGQPFDVVKLRLQTQQAAAAAGSNTGRVYRGLFDCFFSVGRQEGIRAWWKGATPALASAFVENTIVFTMNGIFKRILAGDGEMNQLPLWQNCAAAGAAGFFSSSAMCPAEVVKCRLQFARGSSRGPLQVLGDVVREQGPRGLFKGWTSLVCRDVPYNAAFFGSYEGLCGLLCKWRGKVDDRGFPDKAKMNQLEILLAGGTAGGVGWTLVFPADVVKSRLQSGALGVNSPSFGRALVTIAREEGFAAFRGGWGAAVLRAFPANGALFLGVESFIRGWDYVEANASALPALPALPLLGNLAVAAH